MKMKGVTEQTISFLIMIILAALIAFVIWRVIS